MGLFRAAAIIPQLTFETLLVWDTGLVPIAWKGSGGSADAITDSRGGMLYQEQDAKSLAATLKGLLGMNRDQRWEMIRKSRGWLRNHCEPEGFSPSMFALWEEVLEAHRSDYEKRLVS